MNDFESDIAACKSELKALNKLISNQIKNNKKLENSLARHVTVEISRTRDQIHAQQSLLNLLGDIPGRLGCLNGSMLSPSHGWPVSPDFALNQVRMIQSFKYDLIIEFGSGTSTLLSLRALEKSSTDSAFEAVVPHRLITFEHHVDFYSQTSELLTSCSNRNLLDLRLSPLAPWSDSTGSYLYYSETNCIADQVNAMSSALDRPLKILVIIDGPPGSTCTWSRYPAVPIVLDSVSGINSSIDFLLDDMIREDEKEMSVAWECILQSLRLEYKRTDYRFEKGGLLLRIPALNCIDTSLQCQNSLVLSTNVEDNGSVSNIESNASIKEAVSTHPITLAQSKAKAAEAKLRASIDAIKDLEIKLEQNIAEKTDAQAESRSVLEQLAIVQEQLEHYFLISKEQSRLLDSYAVQSSRALSLLRETIDSL